jgi:hypothetical protein
MAGEEKGPHRVEEGFKERGRDAMRSEACTLFLDSGEWIAEPDHRILEISLCEPNREQREFLR